jgi:hypothetical protein
MSENGNGNGETTIELNLPGGAGGRVSSKRVSELIAILSAIALAVSSSFTYHLYAEIKAFAMKLEATQARIAVMSERLEASNRYLACVTLSRDVDKPRAGADCQTTAGYK